LNYSQVLAICSAVISIAGTLSYIRDTVKGRTKPNRISWLMWSIVTLIGAGAAIDSGANLWAVSRIFLAGFLPLLVFFAPFVNRDAYWHISKFDLLCGAASLASIIVWLYFSSPKEAIILAIIGDLFAGLPTLIKSWNAPETESAGVYQASLLSVFLIIPSIPTWDIPTFSLPQRNRGIPINLHFVSNFPLSRSITIQG